MLHLALQELKTHWLLQLFTVSRKSVIGMRLLVLELYINVLRTPNFSSFLFSCLHSKWPHAENEDERNEIIAVAIV